MPPEAKEFINTLPEWMQGVATIGFLLGSVLLATIGFIRNARQENKAPSKEVVVETQKGENGKPGQAVEAVAVEYMLLHDINETLKDGFDNLERVYEKKLEDHTEEVVKILERIALMMAEELKEKNIEREVLKRIGYSLPPRNEPAQNPK